MRVLREELGVNNHYRIIETIFTNFNLFPQINKTINQTNELNNNQLLGIPISYLIVNRTMVKSNEDIVRFQIQIPEVRDKNLFEKTERVFYSISIR